MIYLDNNATTQPDANAMATAFNDTIKFYGNPSSTHKAGERAKEMIDEARSWIAKSINAKPEEIVFTSGGTEANALALNGKHRYRICSKLEHSSMYEWADYIVRANKDGTVNLENLEFYVKEDRPIEGRQMVAIGLVNNETGVIQPVQAVAELGRKYGHQVHIDAVAAYGKIPIDVQKLDCDTLSISAHKIHGPKGVGALYVREGTKIEPLMRGGAHERGLRPGTENIFGIVAFGEVVMYRFHDDYGDPKDWMDGETHQEMRDEFERLLADVSAVNGTTDRVWNVSNLFFPKVKDVDLFLHLLSEEGVCASGQSACSSGMCAPSRVLTAMYGGGSPEVMGSVRFSFASITGMEEMKQAAEIIKKVLAQL